MTVFKPSLVSLALRRSLVAHRGLTTTPRQRTPPCTCSADGKTPSTSSSQARQEQRRWRSSMNHMQYGSTTTAAGGADASSSSTSSPSTRPSQPAFPSSATASTRQRLRDGDERGNYRPDTRLPVVKDQRIMYLSIAGAAITAWTFFVMWAMSAEKASSTVVRTLSFNLRSSPLVKQVLGEGVKPKPFLFSTEPWVHGTVNTIQGIVDIHFRVQAANGRQGTVYFKSERPTKSARFETVEFKLVVDGNPQPIDLKDISLIN